MARIQRVLASQKTWLALLFFSGLFRLVQAGTSWHQMPQESCDFTDAFLAVIRVRTH